MLPTPGLTESNVDNNSPDASPAIRSVGSTMYSSALQAETIALEQLHDPADGDLQLIWPDSEDLFQSIMSTDVTNQWPMPLNLLPFSPLSDDMHFGNKEPIMSFDERSGIASTLSPTEGIEGPRAVQDVTQMILNQVHQSFTLFVGKKC